jgi:threonine dehydratase
VLDGRPAGGESSGRDDLAGADLRRCARSQAADQPYLRPTPLYSYPALSELVGAEIWVKHENHQPVGAFKVRGGVNLVSRLSEEERGRGLIAASTGNHGQSIAYAARLFGLQARICVPERANPVKLASMRALGAELIEYGRDYDEAREHCERSATERGYRYIHSGAVLQMLEGTRNLVEPAGAAPLAAALQLRHQLAGKRVALVLSGGNISLAQLRELLISADLQSG